MTNNHKNYLLDTETVPEADTKNVDAKTIHRQKIRDNKRDIRDLRRQQNASEALAGLDRETEIYGFTKGQFSVIDLIRAAIEITGPAVVDISTWTAAHSDVTTVLEFLESGKITATRWLVDISFQRRYPELAQRIRDNFGMDSVRVAANHSKFALIKAGEWRLVLFTSMNLNYNPRFENFQIRHDPQLFKFHADILDTLWKKQSKKAALDSPHSLQIKFENDTWQ